MSTEGFKSGGASGRERPNARVVAYADPPYPGCAHLYEGHADYAGEVDHADLATMLLMYDGWVLHTSSPALYDVETHLREAGHSGYRVMPWVKFFRGGAR